MTISLQTRLSIDECNARLLASADIERMAWTMSGFAGSKEILAKVSQQGFRLQKRRTNRNAFAPFFFGHFTAVEGGTLIEGDFNLHPATRSFGAIWFSFLLLFAVGVLVVAPEARTTSGVLPLLGFAALMGVFGVCLLTFGRRLAQGEQGVILAFLKHTFEVGEAE
jgi:hypothetical protein